MLTTTYQTSQDTVITIDPKGMFGGIMSGLRDSQHATTT